MERRRPRQTARKSTATTAYNHRYPAERFLPITVNPNSRLLEGMDGPFDRPLPNTARKSTAFLAADTQRTRGTAYPGHRQGMNQQEFGRNLSKLTRKSQACSQSASSSRILSEPEDGSCPACGWVDKPKVMAVGLDTPKSRPPNAEILNKRVKEEKVAVKEARDESEEEEEARDDETEEEEVQ